MLYQLSYASPNSSQPSGSDASVRQKQRAINRTLAHVGMVGNARPGKAAKRDRRRAEARARTGLPGLLAARSAAGKDDFHVAISNLKSAKILRFRIVDSCYQKISSGPQANYAQRLFIGRVIVELPEQGMKLAMDHLTKSEHKGQVRCDWQVLDILHVALDKDHVVAADV